MRNLRSRSSRNKEGLSGRSCRNDFISQMPDELLLMILDLLPTKDAVATSSLSTRWRFVWCSLNVFDFDGEKSLENMEDDSTVLLINEQTKFINQVNGVIQRHNLPTVQYFRIRFDLSMVYIQEIDHWLQFALDKKVEILELDLMQKSCMPRENPHENYDFPLPLSNRRMRHFYKWPSSDDIVLEMLSLYRLELYGVSVTEPTLKGFLKGAPCLEVLSIYGSHLSTHLHVGGSDNNLKHLKLVQCSGVKFISLCNFDLESFIHVGKFVEYHFDDLPKLTDLKVGGVSVGLEDNVFSQVSCCVSSLQVLHLDIIDGPEEILDTDSVPKLPNVKKLTLIIRATQDDSLLDYTSIAKACPILETFEIWLYWFSLAKRRRKVRRTASHCHKHLKLLKVEGYYGRISDLELVVYVMENAIALQNIVIDPSCLYSREGLTAANKLKVEQQARSSAKRQLQPIVPQGVELTIK
uniref:F-box protein At4g09920-like n=1 Tax=Erigeron canadensis TaxID=72917 RepID=UPI001CB8A377|nr:F-box protein At4g09920-like [Erigeron canadensis]XP_043627688.1 F-box protein At4g09920-like [Erigeron canadensis]